MREPFFFKKKLQWEIADQLHGKFMGEVLYREGTIDQIMPKEGGEGSQIISSNLETVNLNILSNYGGV